MISIIVPVYNSAVFVRRTIDNLLSQDVDKEIILINDGSTDDSLKILNDYAEKNDCVHVIDKPNGGVSSARNAGLEVAKGEYIIFVDADDLLENDTLRRALDSYNDEIDGVYFSYKHVASDNHVIKSIHYLPTGKYDIREWTKDAMRLISTFIVGRCGSCIYRSSFIKEKRLRFNEQMSHFEDIAFGFEYLYYVKELYYIDEPLYWYMHVNPNSLFGGYINEMSLSVEYCIDCVVKVIPTEKCFTYIKELIVSCIQNETIYDIIDYKEKCNNLRRLSQSKYIEYLRLSVAGKIYYFLLNNEFYRLLIIILKLQNSFFRNKNILVSYAIYFKNRFF